MKLQDRQSLQHFDIKELRERTELTDDFLLPMAEKSMSALDNYLRNLGTAINDSNFPEVKTLAHTIKGMALNMSFTNLTFLAKSMEAVETNDFVKAKELFDKMHEEYGIIQQLLK